MAWICTEHSAICSALAAAPVEITTTDAARAGWATAHSTTRMPPIDPPTIAAQRAIPRWSASAASTSTWSRIVMRGNREPYGRPSGASDAGPVVP